MPKYLVVNDNFAILFPDFQDHIDVAHMLSPEHNITGAGFYFPRRGDIDPVVGGDSMTLGMKSKPGDLKFVRVALGEAP